MRAPPLYFEASAVVITLARSAVDAVRTADGPADLYPSLQDALQPGKGEAGSHEYALRMYSRQNAASRPNRISGYAFNPQGGLGSGSYFQDPVTKGEWIYVAVVIDDRTSPGTIAWA